MGRRFKRKMIEGLTVTGIADKGKGVCRDETGRVIFVEDVAPGDVVDVLIYKKRKSYLLGSVKHFQKYSEDRAKPFCEHFGTCGGCKFQHIPYEKQIEYKQGLVDNALRRIGKVEIGEFRDILPCEEPAFYRNKLEFTFSNKRWLTYEELNSEVSNLENVLGFHRAGAFDKILNINKCHLQPEPSNQLRNSMKEIALEQGLTFYDVRQNLGFLRNTIVRTSTTQETMLIVSFGENDKKKIDTFLNKVLEKNKTLTSVFYTINKKVNDSWG
ncbi:MAG TPA: class I SAM-dependent RNA methyltransferase, partial [Phaeodactylibacter sp.]|nr:class I SAM-dependent RNA methyltransferase [Phaeodactylibacter sp.]